MEGATVADVGEAHRAGTPVALRERRADLRGEVIDAVERALAADPLKRFARITDLERALTKARLEQSRRSRRPRSWRAAGLLAATMAVGLAGIFVTLRLSAPDELSIITAVGGAAMVEATGWPSHDGRFYPYLSGGSLGVWEVERGRASTIAVPDQGERGAQSALMSPRGDRIAYVWAFGDDSYELRIADRDGSRQRVLLEPRRAYQPVLSDWSRDGKHLLCWLRQGNGSGDLVLLPLTGGQSTVLHTQTDPPFRATLSPDGRFAAFHRVIDVEKGGGGVMVDTSRRPPRVLTAFGLFPVWTPDGTSILYLRFSKQGRPLPFVPVSFDVWRIPVVGSAAEPEMILPNLGAGVRMSVTDDGRLLTPIVRESHEVYVAAIDLGGSKPPGAARRLEADSINGRASPSWSPTGDAIAYFAMRPRGIPNANPIGNLTIHDVPTGRSREVGSTLAFQGTYQPEWLPTGDAIVVWGADENRTERLGYYRVDVKTGRATPILLREQTAVDSVWQVLPDGTGLLFRHEVDGLLEYSFASSRTKVVVAGRDWSSIGRFFGLSPDGQTLAFNAVTTDKQQVLVLQPAGETPRILRQGSVAENIQFQAWTPDSQSVLFAHGGDARARPIWIVPVTGGEARNTGLLIPNQPNPISLHPRGTHVAYPERVTTRELWIRPIPR